MKYFKLLLFFRIFLSPYWKQFSAAVNEILDFVFFFFLVFQRQTSIIPLHLLDFFFFALLDVVKTVHKLWLWFSEGNLLFRLGIQQWWIKFNSFSTPHENKFSRYKSLRWILSKTNSFTSCTTFNFFPCYIYSFLCTCSYSSSLVSPGAML